MNKSKIIKILLINLLTMATFNMAHPVTPLLINTLRLPTYMFGVLYSTMAFAHFVMSPIWGSLSDQSGRKKFMIIGVVGYGISQLGFGFIPYQSMILVFRILGGAMSVAFITTCIAYLSDISSSEDRTKYLSYHAASTSIGSSIGALIGGYSGVYGYQVAFLLQFVIGILIYFTIEETIDKKEEKIKIYTKHLRKRDSKNKLNHVVGIMMIVMTLITIAITSYNSTINYYVESVLNMPTTVNGIVMAIAGVVALIMNLFVNPYLSKRFNEFKILIIASIIGGISMLVASISSNMIFGFMFILTFVGCSAISTPIQQSIVSKLSNDNYGEIMGIQGSYKAIGMIIGSLLSGFIFDIGNKLPFILSGICLLVVVVMVRKVYLEIK